MFIMYRRRRFPAHHLDRLVLYLFLKKDGKRMKRYYKEINPNNCTWTWSSMIKFWKRYQTTKPYEGRFHHQMWRSKKKLMWVWLKYKTPEYQKIKRKVWEMHETGETFVQQRNCKNTRRKLLQNSKFTSR